MLRTLIETFLPTYVSLSGKVFFEIIIEPPADQITHIGLFIPDGTPTDGLSEAVLASGQSGTLGFQVVIDNPFNEPSLKVENVADILYRLDDGTTEKTKTTNKLEPGKFADLVVLSNDYLGVSEDELKNMRPVLTLVGGKIVYGDGEFASLNPTL